MGFQAVQAIKDLLELLRSTVSRWLGEAHWLSTALITSESYPTAPGCQQQAANSCLGPAWQRR
jgi:hypothetical protein